MATKVPQHRCNPGAGDPGGADYVHGNHLSADFAVVWGLIAELITAKRRKSAGALAVSYCVFNLTSMGPFFALILAKDAFLESCAGYYGEEYIATLDKLTPSWIVLVLIALALVGGLLGGLFGRKILKKHFVKAGITA